MDKIIPYTLVDGGSGIDIMSLSTLEKLGLELIGPSPFIINVADQKQVTPWTCKGLLDEGGGRSLYDHISSHEAPCNVQKLFDTF